MAWARRSGEIYSRLDRDFPGVSSITSRRRGADGLCRQIAHYAAGLADLNADSKQRLLEQAMSPLLKSPGDERTPADWGDLAELQYLAGQYAESRTAYEKANELRGETEPTIDESKGGSWLLHRGVAPDFAQRVWTVGDLVADGDPWKQTWTSLYQSIGSLSERSDQNDATGYPLLMGRLWAADATKSVLLTPVDVPAP